MNKEELERMRNIDIAKMAKQNISNDDKLFYNHYRAKIIEYFAKEYSYWKHHAEDFFIG